MSAKPAVTPTTFPPQETFACQAGLHTFCSGSGMDEERRTVKCQCVCHQDQHVIEGDDPQEHVTDGGDPLGCWCRPYRDIEEPSVIIRLRDRAVHPPHPADGSTPARSPTSTPWRRSAVVAEAIRDRARHKNPVWDSDFEEMARKTAVRRLVKYLPLSPQIRDRLSAEDDISYDDAPVMRVAAPPKDRRAAIAAEAKQRLAAAAVGATP